MEKDDLLKLRTLLINYDKDVKAIQLECYEAQKRADEKCNAATLREVGTDEQLAKEIGGKIKELQLIRSNWKTYIDNVHETFQHKVYNYKKQVAEQIAIEYRELCSVANQSTSTKNGKLSYNQESPTDYALKNIFMCESKALMKFRAIAVCIAVIWAIMVIGKTISEAYIGGDVAEVFSSTIIFIGLYAAIAYIVIDIAWSFFANKMYVEEKNAKRQADAELENKKIIANIANAKMRLKDFDNKYGLYYKEGDSWNFSVERTTISRETVEQLLKEAKDTYTRPKLPAGISEYKFEINYQSL